MNYRRKVLICPLNWGLGHATRDIPVIREFINSDFEVIIAASGASLFILKNEFPQLDFLELPGYKIKYSKRNSQLIEMILLVPRIVFWTLREHKLIKKIITDYKIDIVVSDNRFGLWNRNTYNIFITHQLRVKFPGVLSFFEPLYKKISGYCISKFHECWIPDFEGDDNLSGELSHTKTKLKNLYFINPLSRFSYSGQEEATDIDILYILSGPEPQRSIFENMIFHQTKKLNINMLMVRGTIEKSRNQFNYQVVDLANSNELAQLISKSKLIICRSGYTSVMDLFTLKKKAVLVPTPGQTEQEYLAGYLYKRNLFYSIRQQEFNLEEAIENALEFPEGATEQEDFLKERIQWLKEKYYSKRDDSSG